MWRQLYNVLFIPKAPDEDNRRRELILNILLIGVTLLVGVLFSVTVIKNFAEGAEYDGVSPLMLLGVIAVFCLLFILSRARLYRLVAYIFTALFLSLIFLATLSWGINLPQAILGYSLSIVMAGVLLSSRMSFYMAIVISSFLVGMVYATETGLVNPDTSWIEKPGNYSDAIGYSITFIIIALVSWLSNREIERSLARARLSEKELLKERNSLEIKVRERTKDLEKAQVEKMLDLQRFAEFGRLSSTLLHELANPLTAVSLNLEQLEGKTRSKLISHAREGIAHMEQYVEAARRQLRNQSEIKLFDVSTEIERVAGFLEAKGRSQQVEIKLDLIKDISIKGDSIRFNHIISNLLTNAIDAYDGVVRKQPKIITVVMRYDEKEIKIAVSDHGRGIDKHQIQHLFEPFYTTKESLRGTGIGLAITKQAVEEAFHGTINVAYDKQQGTVFTVRIPAS